MFARCFYLVVTAILIGRSASAQDQELTEVDAPGGFGNIFMEEPATQGSGMYCEYEVRDVHFGTAWYPLVSIMLDEGEETDKDSKYLQLDMTFLSEEDGAISHNFLKGGFDNNYEAEFLIHWRRAPWYGLELIWQDDGLFRYSATLAGSVVAKGEFVQPDFDPKHIRVALSGLQAGIFCEAV